MEFIGHKEVRQIFSKLVDKDALSHANLIIGEEGIGKSKLARSFAMKILGKKEDKDYADIVNYRLKDKSIGIDEVRSIIQEVNKKPFEGDKKVIIIHQGNKLTVQAQNALLKTIEEPPSGVYIIILCESGELILETIKSRCQIYKLSPLRLDEVEHFLDKNFSNLEEGIKKAAIAYSGGIPGKAEGFIKDEKLSNLREIVSNLLKDIVSEDKEIVIKYEERLKNYKEEWEQVLQVIVSFIRDILMYKEIENKELIINRDKLHEIDRLSKELSFIKLEKMVRIIDEVRENLRRNTNFSLSIDVMIMGLMEG